MIIKTSRFPWYRAVTYCTAMFAMRGFSLDLNEMNAPVCSAPNPYSPYADYGKVNMKVLTTTMAMMHEDKIGQLQAKVLEESLNALKVPIKLIVRKKRPCGCDGGFPSGHMIHIGWGASFVYHRYGWQYGLPLYAGSSIFAKDRHNAKAHSWFDLIGTTLLMHAAGYLTVSPYRSEQYRNIPALKKFHFLMNNRSILVTYDIS